MSLEESVSLPLPDLVIQHHLTPLFEVLKNWHSKKSIPPVLLMTGIPGVGKRSLAYHLAQWIFCQESGFQNRFHQPFAPLPCGTCLSCKKNWIDFIEIYPENETSPSLKIGQFRDLKTSMGFGAYEGAYKIILISHADQMTLAAANSVLKLLEEPPQDWLFFLTVGDPTLLLPTIVSRCQKLRLKPFSDTQIQELLSLQGIHGEKQRICARLAQGSWGKALELTQDQFLEQRITLFHFIQDPIAFLSSLVEWAAEESSHLHFMINQMEQLTTELIQWSLTMPLCPPDQYSWKSEDGKTALVSHIKSVMQFQDSAQWARNFWIDRVECLAKVRQHLHVPLNRKLLIQDLLIPWLTIPVL